MTLTRQISSALAALLVALSGSAVAQSKANIGVTDTTINVGVLSVLTGPVALQGLPVAVGNEAYFKYANDNLNGLGKRKIKVLKQDHQYNAQTANQIFAQMEPQVAMFAQLFGTPIIAALERRRKESGSLIIPSTFGSKFYADSQLVIPFAPYTIQITAGIDYLVKEKNAKALKWAIVSRHDVLGADGVAGFDFAVKHYGLQVATRQTYEPSDSDFTTQIQAIKDSGAQVVVLANTSAVTAQFVVGLARVGVHPIWLGWQPSFDPGLAKNAEFMAIVAKNPYYIASCLPAWSTDSPGMKQVREVRQKYAPGQVEDPYFTFGYIQGSLSYAILEAATKRNDFSREGIRKALADVGATDLGGLLTQKVDFSKPPHERFPRAIQMWTVAADVPSFQAPASGFFSGEAASKYPMPISK
jgi:ABC-type branched-subunit amino acid transport system substrate-binding protein